MCTEELRGPRLNGGFARKASKESVIISSVNDKEAEDRAEQNDRKCEVYGSGICLFVCFLFCFVLFCFVLFCFVFVFLFFVLFLNFVLFHSFYFLFCFILFPILTVYLFSLLFIKVGKIRHEQYFIDAKPILKIKNRGHRT